MEVYIEDAIFDTTIINLAILYLTVFSLRQKINFLKLLFSALIGCLISVALTFFTLPFYLLLLTKILSGLLMCVIVVPKFSINMFVLFFLVFISFTCLVGGFCFFVIYLLGGEVYSLSKMTYNLPISLGVITLLIWLYILFLIKIINIFYKKQKLESFYFDIKVYANKKNIQLKAYLDSGNLLQDPTTNLPILIINLKTFLKLYKDKINLIDFYSNKISNKLNGKYINFCSVGKSEKIFVFMPEQVQIIKQNIKEDIKVLIGVSANNFSNSTFDALLSPLCV